MATDLLAVGSTTILRVKAGQRGHWRRRGVAITLFELFEQFGKDYTAYELLFWYRHSEKVVRKRAHSWASQEKKDAAHERLKEYSYCHWRHSHSVEDIADPDVDVADVD